MLLHAVLFFSFLAAATTLVAMLPRLIRARIWVGLPVGLVLIGATGTVGSFAGGDIALDNWLSGGALLAVIVVRLWMPRWSWLGAQLFATATLAALSYLLYAGTLTFAGRHGYIYFAGSTLLLLLELAALSLSVSYCSRSSTRCRGARIRPLDWTRRTCPGSPSRSPPTTSLLRWCPKR